jgi:ADP-heptose:LPS heptosyltransferase
MFGPTDPRRTGPYGQSESILQQRMPCVPCLKPSCTWRRPLECLRTITPQAVYELAEGQLLRLASGDGPPRLAQCELLA